MSSDGPDHREPPALRVLDPQAAEREFDGFIDLIEFVDACNNQLFKNKCDFSIKHRN